LQQVVTYIAWEIYPLDKFTKAATFKLHCDQIDVPIPTDLAHFIQKFEMEEIMEFESVNKGFHSLDKK
jgi:deoxyribodipyrimidine photo-lyase